ncbi:hypothetical protein SteCoe_31492 [Stentor coeruleus]|uniref:non-specific serine/threonine protein kinase n=1 Tax=Stentor coeruleus TaxID=5963 RepID=A0A1R2B181_9CILI|nr:hypothetical protein SteCoe_31492 [Stentor coeruleus]
MGCCPSKKATENVISVESIGQVGLGTFNLVHANEKKFLDQYKVEHSLGTGSYGEVRKVLHKVTGQERAVKLFIKSLDDSQSYMKVKSEIQILKTLHHPCIIKMFEYFEDEKRLYIVLEKCNGGELFDMISEKSNLTENTAAIICKQMFSAVAYMHQNNIIHRDIKPENIMLEEFEDDLNIKIIDFGTAIKISGQARLIELVGSPFYIAPEVVAGNYSYECDMWSCGVILYILLSGYPPFDAKSSAEILKKIRLGKYSFDKPIWESVSNDAKNLISKLLCPAEKRMNASQALCHPWIKSLGIYPKPQKTQLDDLKNNLKGFYNRNKLHNAISAFISSQIISSKETKELRNLFKSLDTNGDGRLSKEELLNGFDDNHELITEIMLTVDADKNGYIDLDEFLVAAVNQTTLLSRENMKKAFDMFDLDGNGTISYDELQTVLGVGTNTGKSIWMEIMKKKKNGQELSFQEFCEILISLVE